MQEPGNQRFIFIFALRLPSRRQRAKRAAVVAAVAGNEFMPVMLADLLLVLARYFEGCLVCFRSAVGEEDHVIALQPFVQLLGKRDSRHMALGQRKIRQAEQLIVGRLGQLLASISDIYTPQAGHAVQKFVSIDIGNP
ncbi:hypothetical protein D3C86_1737240 [compost metagenome]